jgi:hypothetical protein
LKFRLEELGAQGEAAPAGDFDHRAVSAAPQGIDAETQ